MMYYDITEREKERSQYIVKINYPEFVNITKLKFAYISWAARPCELSKELATEGLENELLRMCSNGNENEL